jgi:uncharacterized membrane protein (UPF0127 family)
MPPLQSILIIASSAAVLALAGFYAYRLIASVPHGWEDGQFATVSLNGHDVRAEVAASPQKKAQGLSGRQSLGEGTGMLFVFDKPQRQSFWMKGMLIPLDFVWIDGETVVDITENVPPPSGTFDLSIISPSSPADKVLEIDAGAISRYGIERGQRIAIRRP